MTFFSRWHFSSSSRYRFSRQHSVFWLFYHVQSHPCTQHSIHITLADILCNHLCMLTKPLLVTSCARLFISLSSIFHRTSALVFRLREHETKRRNETIPTNVRRKNKRKVHILWAISDAPNLSCVFIDWLTNWLSDEPLSYLKHPQQIKKEGKKANQRRGERKRPREKKREKAKQMYFGK